MLFDLVVGTVEDDRTTQSILRVCAADYESRLKSAFVADNERASLCTTANRVLDEASVHLHQPPSGNNDDYSVNHLLSAGRQIANHLALQMPSCKNNAMEFAYSQSSAIGLFAGAEIHQHGVSSDILEEFLEYAQEKAISKTIVVQLCGANNLGADYSLGIVATSSKNLHFIQESVRTWANGNCVPQVNANEGWMRVTLRFPGAAETIANGTNKTTTRQIQSIDPAQLGAKLRLRTRTDCLTTTVQSGDGCSTVAQRCGIKQTDLEKFNRPNICNTLITDEMVCCNSGPLPSTLPPGNSDGTCKLRTVVSGDDCGSLASKCGISGVDFIKANDKADLCSTLAEGQQVCCTAGKRPDLKPKPDADGNCAEYITKQDDSCSKIAVARDLNTTDLMNFNKDTWGWNGCDSKNLYPDFLMCVSTGNPPMPAIVPNAVCGPTMPGTVKPPSGTNLSTLNPCPLNVCCNIWGQCGTTDDFCTAKQSETGAPGTSGDPNGCVSNCGRDIIKGPAPASKIKVAYYESWNLGRKCLNMWVDQISSDYTHVHFAFANITRNTYKPEITDETTKEQFESFKGMIGVKKIISFGGWAFSTEPGTFSILREAVLPANRETFKNNIISFLNEHNLDGVDLDWEYPGAPDIPDIPSDDPVNGLNYYRLLASIKSTVGSSKSVSFAAPASYWYLKSFPIKNMAENLDYIIYMTYDLHGQWDYGNKWTMSGCESGNCLRSHVNETETKDALAMITKAGVVSNKIVVGVPSYGRSFKMESAGCDSEMCKFTGSPRLSNANKGRCTDTGGYISNAEIQEIMATGKVNKKWTSEGSNIMVYNDTEWVAYMDDDMKKKRSETYDSYNFAGTVDWAVDLQEWWDGEAYINENYWSPCTGSYTTLQQLEDHKSSIPSHCVEQYLVDVQVAVLGAALKRYKDLVDNGYDKRFEVYEKNVKNQIPDQINNFMASDKVDKFFKCKETKKVVCCRTCRFDNCMHDCVKGNDCKDGWGTIDMDKCPRFEFESRAFSEDHIPNATFTLTDGEGFYKDLSDTWAIDEDWIRYDKRHMRTNNGCQYEKEKVLECIAQHDNFFYNYPLPNDDKIEIYNPKKLIGDSYPRAEEMLERFKIMDLMGDWDEQTMLSDLVDATSLPAFSTQEAIASMGKIVEKANDIEKKEREELILDFITGLLFFIPLFGEAAGAASLTTARTLLHLIGAVGDTALTIYDVVKNPENAFMAVFTYLAGAGVGRAGFKDAANSRRGISQKDYDGLGNVKTSLDKIDSIRSIMCQA
ncbi:hypothetical protein BDV96DRAFT_642744 [Lophiotrema nucula]|uniref:chitinase n=1 Tax=Lophiotrema nucula TaxID=690887 RepID=A0A6A5ZKR1_9PLEO|nr:hypothetical protein BDV96DRAFT_642744 [Lophiotrema nucula]